MVHQKILNLLIEGSDSRFVTRQWNIVNSQSKMNYDVACDTICNRELSKSIFLITTMLSF